MRKLILIKHSLPEIDPGRPARQWQLNVEGRRRCEPLAQQLERFKPPIIYSSDEPKAIETAALVAARLGVLTQTVPDLHEHDRHGVGLLPQAEFEQAVASFFAQPDQIVLGRESARAASTRFAAAIDQLVTRSTVDPLVVVAHGTVISLWVAQHNPIDAHVLWQRFGLPAFMVCSLPDGRLLETIDSIT